MKNKINLSDKQMALLLATLTAIMPFSVDAYLPAIPSLAHDLGADIHYIEKSLSTFMFGVAFGQLVGGSISDVKGRRPVALGGLLIYILGSFGLALAHNADQLLILRIVQALGAGMAAVMTGAIVRDYYDGRQAAQMFALIGIIMMAAPLFAPMLGSMLQALAGWRAIFVFLMIYATIVGSLLFCFLPKPKEKGIFTRRFLYEVLSRYYQVLRTKIALGFLFFQAFSFSSMLVFLTESPFVYMKIYGLTPQHYAWVFGCNIITMSTFNRITAWRLKSGSNAQDILKWGVIVQLIANTLMVAVVFADGGKPPLWCIIVCAMVSVGTQGLVVANTQACFMGYFRQVGGSANALLMSASSLIGALMGWSATVAHNGTAYIMPILMLCSTLIGTILLFGFSRKVWTQNKA